MDIKQSFIGGYENVVNPLFKVTDARLGETTARLKEMLLYNSTDGKLNRGIAVLHTTQLLTPDVSAEVLQEAVVLGWCVEILQAFLLVADDIMDRSLTRRGKACWYRREDVGLMAINDSFLLESCVFELLKIHLINKPYYINCLHLFLDTSRKTEQGQALDLVSDKLDLSHFTMERYDAVVEYKTAYYSFYLPVALALHLCGRDSQLELECARNILLKIGHYFQVQDDYLDCYGDPAIIGKIGTDIQEKKCSWLFVTAVQSGTPEQVERLYKHYGISDDSCVAAVKSLYKDLDIETKYLDYANKTYLEITDMINNDKSGLPSNIFQDFLDKIHKRNK